MDIHGQSDMPLIAQDSNPGRVRIVPGGVARNVAENLARLDMDVRLVSAVGDDDNGRMLIRNGQEAGIDTEAVRVIDNAATATYVSILNDDGEMAIAVSDMGVIEHIGAAALADCEDTLNQASLIVIDTNLGDSALAWLAETLVGQVVFVDTVSTTKALRIEPYLAAVHTLKTSRIEAEALSGIDAAEEHSLREAATWFHARGVKRVFITLGEQGVFFSTGDQQGHYRLDAAATGVRNVGGAGDAFLAGLACAWLDELSLEDTLRFALAAAEVTLACPGTNNPSLSRAAIAARLERELG